MISIKFNTKEFTKTLVNSIQYSDGFLDGAKSMRFTFNQELGIFIEQALNKYIDAKARMNPEAFHHIYEWGQTGSSNARLFEFKVTPMQTMIKFTARFLPSSSISPTSEIPFKDKAKIMESGVDITIEPKDSETLVFEDDGETIFTRKEITISNPGGSEVVGSFERVVNEFFSNYLTKGILRSSGIFKKLERASAYTKDFKKGSKNGKPTGVRAGQKYMNIGGAEVQ